MEDREISDKKRYIDDEIGDNIFEIKDLELGYGKNILAEKLSFKISKGKITSIIGKSGAGKSSLLNLLVGIVKYKKGSILFEGREFKKLKDRELLQEIGIVFQNPQNQFITYKVIDELLFTLNRVYKNQSEKNMRGLKTYLESLIFTSIKIFLLTR